MFYIKRRRRRMMRTEPECNSPVFTSKAPAHATEKAPMPFFTEKAPIGGFFSEKWQRV
jgi:hypothetical protein